MGLWRWASVPGKYPFHRFLYLHGRRATVSACRSNCLALIRFFQVSQKLLKIRILFTKSHFLFKNTYKNLSGFWFTKNGTLFTFLHSCLITLMSVQYDV